MANVLSPAERALQILAEIEQEEKLKNKRIDTTELNKTNEFKNIPAGSIASDVNTSATQLSVKNIQVADQSFNMLNALTQDDLLKGIVLSEILSKPLALRRYRRF